jgi:hypothetical protein
MNDIWIHKARSWSEAARFDQEYHLSQSAEKRIDDLQRLRETYYKINGKRRKRLQRVITIIQ